MAEKVLNVRLQIKYDTFENWSKTDVANKGANLILKAGEIGACYVPATSTTEATTLFKVGDGTTAYTSLPWASGLAADVFDWAKASSKPNYTAEEINDTSNKVLMTTIERTKLSGIAEEATKVESSSINGNIKINDTDTTIYTHPTVTAVSAAAKKVGYDTLGHVILGDTLTASDVGAATSTDITNAINALDVSNISGFGKGKTLSALSETDGKISATFQDIEIN